MTRLRALRAAYSALTTLAGVALWCVSLAARRGAVPVDDAAWGSEWNAGEDWS